MSDIKNLRDTIIPKSDQINSEQLLGGPITITVTNVRRGDGEQPLVIGYANDNGRPYKPCKTMRKVLIFAWGEDGSKWIGRSMTLFNEPSVKFGGVAVGGIRISHLSHIDRELKLSLTATRGKKDPFIIHRLEAPAAAPDLVEKYRKRLAAVAVESGEAAVAEAWAKTPEPVRMALGGPFLESLVEGARAAEVERNRPTAEPYSPDAAPVTDDADGDDPF